MLHYSNLDLNSIVTPVNYEKLQSLLIDTKYDRDLTDFLVDGFKNGFSLEYQGSRHRRMQAPNLKFTIGNKVELWNKVMKEVGLGRYAGPYDRPPFEYYVQSPIGLVPKDEGRQTRLIFHLSYPRDGKSSINANTLRNKCVVTYKDFNHAIQLCLKIIEKFGTCVFAKTDLVSTFRNLGIRPQDWPLLTMKAENPDDGKVYFFIDKCLPFGHTISCALFQKVSDALEHICRVMTSHEAVNYLNDFLFIDVNTFTCNSQMQVFLGICIDIGFPVSEEKTHWATDCLAFLGLLIDSIKRLVCVPIEKITKARNLINYCLDRRSRKITLLELQRIAGYLNFLCRVIVPGRPFTRRLYYACKNLQKPYHHTNLTGELKKDLRMWLDFLNHPTVYCRPFLDFDNAIRADQIDMYTDASRNFDLGAGDVCQKSWYYLRWNREFMEEKQPSIEYLELYAVAVAVLNWIHRFSNRQVILFCDNISVVYMINRCTSTCKNCLKLIRLIVFEGLIHNVRIFANYVSTKQNAVADALSRSNLRKFYRITKGKYEISPTEIPSQLWAMQDLWED